MAADNDFFKNQIVSLRIKAPRYLPRNDDNDRSASKDISIYSSCYIPPN